MDKAKLNKIIKNCYHVYAVSFTGMYSDSDWHHVYNLANELKIIPGVVNVEVKAGKYYNYNFDNNNAPYRDHEIIITTKYGTLSGYIRCCSAGTIDEPFSKYDMVIYVGIDPDLNESFSDIKSKAAELFKSKLKNAKSFTYIKDCAKKAIVMGAPAAMVISMIVLSVNLTPTQRQDITEECYQTEISSLLTDSI